MCFKDFRSKFLNNTRQTSVLYKSSVSKAPKAFGEIVPLSLRYHSQLMYYTTPYCMFFGGEKTHLVVRYFTVDTKYKVGLERPR